MIIMQIFFKYDKDIYQWWQRQNLSVTYYEPMLILLFIN